jgi:hypothetical protein
MSPLIQTLVMSILGGGTLGGLRLATFFAARDTRKPALVSVAAGSNRPRHSRVPGRT